MALIAPEDLATLQSATSVKTVAESAPLDAEKAALAKLINSAANTGQMEVLYNHPISEDAVSALEGQGYTVTQRSSKITSSPEYQYVISWK